MNGNGSSVAVSEITEGQILNIIDKGYRTAGSIKKQLGIPSFKDITEDLKYLVDDGKIIRFDFGAGLAYFRPDQRPLRAWLAGDGRVNAEFDGDDGDASQKGEERPARNVSRKRVEFTVADLEKAATENKSQPLIAAALGCSSSLLALRLQKKEFRVAYDRGVAKRVGGNSAGRPLKKRSYTRKAVTDAPPVVTEIVQDLGIVDETPAASEQSATVHSRYLTFARGGQLLVAFEGNIFDLHHDELEMVASIGDLMSSFAARMK